MTDNKNITNNPSLWDIFLAFLSLGCISFGGPIAHIGFLEMNSLKNDVG